MTTSLRIRLGLLFTLALALVGCEGPCSKIETVAGPKLQANGVDLSTYVAVGTSLSSGYESGGLVDRHQIHSFPSLFARQLGKTVQIDGRGDFTQPTVNFDGIPALSEIKSYSPLIINNAGRTTGAPSNSSQNSAYHNLGVPGAILFDLVNESSYYQTAPPVFRTNFTFFNLIARHQGTILSQALSLAPTIMSLEYGANEVLGFTAVRGTEPPAGTGSSYAQLMTASLNAIHTALPNTRVAVFNVPDVTTIPFFTTLRAFTVSLTTGQPVPLVADTGPLGFGDLVLLPAAGLIATGTGIPVGGYNYLNPAAGSNGQRLPESLILRSSEVDSTRVQIAIMNSAVESASLRSYVAKVDLAGLLSTISIEGLILGGNQYSSEFITGGLFSLDGVHPNDLGYALMANTMIDAANLKWGCAIPRVNALAYASFNASRAQPVLENNLPRSLEGLEESLQMLFGRRP